MILITRSDSETKTVTKQVEILTISNKFPDRRGRDSVLDLSTQRSKYLGFRRGSQGQNGMRILVTKRPQTLKILSQTSLSDEKPSHKIEP